MIEMNDISFTINPENLNEGGIAIAFGIDGEIVHILNTYTWFFDLLNSGYSIVDAELENDFVLNFVNQEEIVQSLKCSELLHALLRSNPDIIEIVRQPLPPKESLGDLQYIDIGWKYNNEKNIYPPEGWKPPVKVELTEEQKQRLRELGHNV